MALCRGSLLAQSISTGFLVIDHYLSINNGQSHCNPRHRAVVIVAIQQLKGRGQANLEQKNLDNSVN